MAPAGESGCRRMCSSQWQLLSCHTLLHHPLRLQRSLAIRARRRTKSSGSSPGCNLIRRLVLVIFIWTLSISLLVVTCGGHLLIRKVATGSTDRLNSFMRSTSGKPLACLLPLLHQKAFHMFSRVVCQHGRMLPLLLIWCPM